MSAALYIVARDKPPALDIFVNGKALAQAEARLAAAAQAAGVAELMSFFSQNPDEAAEFMEEDSPGLPPETWFEAEEGLKTVRALLAHFSATANPADAAIIAELRELEEALQRLRQAGLQWHLAVDF